MSEIEIKIEGLNNLERNSNKYSQHVLDALDEAVQRGALKVLATAKELSPVDTGRLRNSIHYSKTGEAEAEVKATANYSTFIEFGTSRQRAQPFMRPAAEANEREIVRQVKELTKDAKP